MTPAFWRVPSSFLAWQTTVRLECFPLVILLRFPSRVWKTQPDLTVCACRLLVCCFLLCQQPSAICSQLWQPHMTCLSSLCRPFRLSVVSGMRRLRFFPAKPNIDIGKTPFNVELQPLSLFTLRQWTIGQYELMSPWLFKINPTKLLKHYICQRVLIPPPSDYGLGTPPSHCEQPCPRHLMVVGFWSLLLQVIA